MLLGLLTQCAATVIQLDDTLFFCHCFRKKYLSLPVLSHYLISLSWKPPQFLFVKLLYSQHLARTYLQLQLRQWGAGNVYLLVLSSWKVNIAENPIAVMGRPSNGVVDTFGQSCSNCRQQFGCKVLHSVAESSFSNTAKNPVWQFFIFARINDPEITKFYCKRLSQNKYVHTVVLILVGISYFQLEARVIIKI